MGQFVKETDKVKLLGIIIDKPLSFIEHAENLFQKPIYKIHALPQTFKETFNCRKNQTIS